MSIADLIRRMSAAGATAEAIAIAVEAIEAEQNKIAEGRAKAAERKARQRNRERDSHGTVTGHERDTVPPKKETSPTPPKEKTTPSMVSEPDGSSTNSPEPEKSAPVAIASPTVFELPCVSGEMFPVSQADFAEWREAFPAVDIQQQLAAMRSWLNANETRRKTRRGMKRFIVSWLDRKQNSASPSGHQMSGSPPRNDLDRMNAALDNLISGAPDEPYEPHQRTIDTSFERRDSGSSQGIIQFPAVSARY